MPFEFAPQALDGLVLVRPRVFEDDRGRFLETYQQADFAAAGLGAVFVQDNASVSRRGVLRGIHYQLPPHAQAKLVRCGRGRVFDVAVDIRKGSPTFGKWTGVELSAENGLQLMIPAGFLHGFVTREPDSELLYKCTDFYAPDCDGAVRFDDPDLAIDWGIDPKTAILSDKDAGAPLFRNFATPFRYEA